VAQPNHPENSILGHVAFHHAHPQRSYCV
jgi:hypothetical protein